MLTIKPLLPFLPEILVLFFTVASLIAGVCAVPAKARKTAERTVCFGFWTALGALAFLPVSTGGAPLFVQDAFAVSVKRLIAAGALITAAFGADWLRYKKYSRFEFAPLLGFCVFGMMLTVSARSFLTQFLGIEAASFPLLFLTAYKRRGERSTRAGTKFAVTEFAGTGLYLFGVSVIFACFGTADFELLAAADKTRILPAVLWGLSFVAAGLAVKIGLAPFHLWAPDVYEGAPAPVTAVFAVLARLCFAAALARIVAGPFADLESCRRYVLGVMGVLSVFIGGFGAVVQTNVKRLLAYTVVVQNGFLAQALVAADLDLTARVMFADFALLAGLSAIMLSMRVGDDLSEELRVLSGQGRVKPVRGALFSAVFLGLAGVPPFIGFESRIALFKAAADQPVFAVLSAAGGALVMYVYLKLIRQMYMVSAKEELSAAPAALKTVIVLSAAASVFAAAGGWK